MASPCCRSCSLVFKRPDIGSRTRTVRSFSLALTNVTLAHLTDSSALLGAVFIHLAVESSSPHTRRSTLSTLERLAATAPEHLNLANLAAVSSYLSHDKISAKTAATSDEPERTVNKETRLPAFILACAAFADDCPLDVKERLLWDWVIVAHHPGPCECQLRCGSLLS